MPHVIQSNKKVQEIMKITSHEIDQNYKRETFFNSIQAEVFCYYIARSPYLLSNYHQTWHDSSLSQNLSKAVKVKQIMTSL